MTKHTAPKIIFAFLLLACLLAPLKNNASAADSRYFPETGKTVAEPFLNYWITHGGLTQQGFPITDAYQEKNDADGKTYNTQYFERARFEYHPENNDPKFQVLLGLLGKEALTSKYGATSPDIAKKVVPGSGTRTFPETGKTVTGMFLSYWQSHGGLEQQGFPITNAYEEQNDADGKTYITQYFERARFEYHPENNDPKFQVLLGLVGQEIFGSKSGNPAGGTGGTGGTTTPPPPPWAGTTIPTPIDSAFLWPSSDPSTTKAYFTKGGTISWYDLKTKEHNDPKNTMVVQNFFRGLAFTSVSDVIAFTATDPNYGLLFLYNGPVYSIFQVQNLQVLGAQAPNPPLTNVWTPGPVFPVANFFTDIDSTSRDTGFDAAAQWPSNSKHKNQTYIFQSTYVTLYDTKTHSSVFGEGGSITTVFPGMPLTRDLDAVIPWPNGKVYFFKDDQYAVWDIETNKPDPGYPRPIN